MEQFFQKTSINVPRSSVVYAVLIKISSLMLLAYLFVDSNVILFILFYKSPLIHNHPSIS